MRNVIRGIRSVKFNFDSDCMTPGQFYLTSIIVPELSSFICLFKKTKMSEEKKLKMQAGEIQRISLSEMQTQKPCCHLVWRNEFNPEAIIHEIFLIK